MSKHTARADRRALLDTVLASAIFIFGTAGLVWYQLRCDCCHSQKNRTVVPMEPVKKQSKLPRIDHPPMPLGPKTWPVS